MLNKRPIIYLFLVVIVCLAFMTIGSGGGGGCGGGGDPIPLEPIEPEPPEKGLVWAKHGAEEIRILQGFSRGPVQVMECREKSGD